MLSGLGIFLTSQFVVKEKEWQALLSVTPWSIILASLLLLVSYFMGGLRLSVLARLSSEKLTFIQGIRAHALGLFSAAVTPSGSGHTPAMALSLITTGLSSSKAWAISFFTIVLDLLYFSWFLPLAILWLIFSPRIQVSGAVTATIIVLVSVFVSLWYLLAFRMAKLEHLLHFVFRLPYLPKCLYRWYRPILRFTRKFSNCINVISGHGWQPQFYLQITTACLHLAIYSMLCILLLGLGNKIFVLDTIFATMLVSIVSYVIPTPGASGYMEFAMPIFLSQQLNLKFVVSGVLVWRLLSHYSSFILAPLLSIGLLKFVFTNPANYKPNDQSSKS